MGCVLICGGAGYIGSHVNKLLARKGYETVVYDNLVYGHREAVKWGRLIEGDLGDEAALDAVFSAYPVDAVLHFAAYAYVGESVLDPEKYYRNNVTGTLNLLEVMRRHGCGRLIFSSTCATYGVPDRLPITEDHVQNPVNPYGFTKLAVERILKDYHAAYGLEAVALRYFNAAGADPDGQLGESHDPETHLIPLVLEAAAGLRPDVKVFGTDYPTPDGSCVRDYVHVTDLAEAHLAALEYLRKGGGIDFFNLGNEKGASVLEVIAAVRRVTGRDFKVTLAPRRPGDPPRLVGSAAKARRVLSWRPRYGDIDTICLHAWRWLQKKEY